MATPKTIGKYEILGQIGRGGMGVVYLARDPLLDRQVALKVLGESTDNAEFHQRFYREARTTARLQHPNIVTIFEFGEAEGQLFIAMEYLSGQPLSELIRRRDVMSLEQRLEIVLDVCAGLGYAHRQGVVHRDVKPGNVILLEDGTAKLLDFGTALLGASSHLTQAGMLVGTIGYMAPEMATGGTVDWRADIFAVGTMLYELLTWQRPFDGGGSVAGSLARIIREDPPRPSLLVPALPTELDAIVERCLRKNPDDRYANLEGLAADLTRFRDSQSPATLRHDVWRPDPLVAPQPAIVPAPEPPPTVFTRVADADIAAALPPASDGTVIISPEPLAAAEDDAVVRLLVGRSPDPHLAGQTLTIPHAGVTLGRDDDCDIVGKDPNWSRRHAAIRCHESGFVIADLGSANGTFVNGRRVQGSTPEPLFFGATITIGETILTFSYGRDTSLPDLSGVVVAQRYELERLLRESPKAALYAARDRNLPRDVAMKLLSPDLAKYAGYREQFEREARTAAQLQHPHICQVLDSGLTRIITASGRRLETHFLCFELMAGGSLAARLKRDEPLALHDIHRWSGMLGSALHYAHEQEVVHGDLKPSAVVFDAAGNLYLTDFSIAQKALVEGRHTVGAPAFMAPEQWDGEPPTPAADQFAFAALVYLMIAGSRPFEGQDNPDIRQKNFRRGPLAVHVEAKQNGRTDISRAASEVLGRALSVDRANRFGSVEQFTRALLKALGTGRLAGADPMVFISYDRELSGGWARFFADRLTHAHGIKVFMDTAGLDRAGRFPPRLRRAIEDCDVFICFLAERSLASKWVSEEIRLAHQFSKTMIPIFQESYVEPDASDDQSPVGTLIAHQGVKLFDISGHFVEHAVTDLAKLVKGAVNGEADC